MENNIHKHSYIKSITLHLLPGLLVAFCFFALVPFVKSAGYPSVMALIISGTFVLIPFELGYLFFQKKKTGEEFFKGIIRYVKPLPVWQYFVFVPVIFISAGILFKVFGFTSDLLQVYFFRWISSDFLMNMGIDGNYEKSKLVITYVLFLVMIVIVLPVTEELYFRGYLLPRMPSGLKGCTEIVHSLLFALYHFWTPWMFIVRTFGVLPLIYIVKRKENIRLGIISHCLLNSMDFFVAISYLFRM